MTTWSTPPVRPSGVCQSWTWKGWELLGRGEVGTLGQKHPGFKTVKRLDEEKGWVRGAQNIRLKKQTKLLLPCIHGNHLRTNLSPCWDLLFLQRKWLKEVEVRKPRTEMRLALLTLILCQLHFRKSFSLKISMDSVSVFRHQITVLQSESTLWGSWHWDWMASWGSDTNELRSLHQLFELRSGLGCYCTEELGPTACLIAGLGKRGWA